MYYSTINPNPPTKMLWAVQAQTTVGKAAHAHSPSNFNCVYLLWC